MLEIKIRHICICGMECETRHELAQHMSKVSSGFASHVVLGMQDVMQRNKRAGDYFFSEGAMRYFGSRIESELRKSKFFITSEQPPHGARKFTVREFDHSDSSIRTLGGLENFCQMTRGEAVKLWRSL